MVKTVQMPTMKVTCEVFFFFWLLLHVLHSWLNSSVLWNSWRDPFSALFAHTLWAHLDICFPKRGLRWHSQSYYTWIEFRFRLMAYFLLNMCILYMCLIVLNLHKKTILIHILRYTFMSVSWQTLKSALKMSNLKYILNHCVFNNLLSCFK